MPLHEKAPHDMSLRSSPQDGNSIINALCNALYRFSASTTFAFELMNAVAGKASYMEKDDSVTLFTSRPWKTEYWII